MAVTPTEDPKYAQGQLADRIVEDEVICMDAGPGPFWPHWQRLYDRTAHHELGLFAHLSWSGDFAVDPGGTSSAFVVRVGAINAINLYNATASRVLAYAGGTLGPSKIAGGGGTLSNGVFHYVYAFLSAGGALDFEITTTGPNAARTSKSGDPTRRYVGCFPTTSAGAPIPLRASRGRCVYRRSGLADGSLRAGGGTATAWASVDLSGFVPPHARTASVELVAASGGTLGSAQIRTAGDTAGGVYAVNVLATLYDTSRCVFELETDSSRAIEYQNSHASITTDANVCGFSE